MADHESAFSISGDPRHLLRVVAGYLSLAATVGLLVAAFLVVADRHDPASALRALMLVVGCGLIPAAIVAAWCFGPSQTTYSIADGKLSVSRFGRQRAAWQCSEIVSIKVDGRLEWPDIVSPAILFGLPRMTVWTATSTRRQAPSIFLWGREVEGLEDALRNAMRKEQ